jgi:signal transduction histidine kinase
LQADGAAVFLLDEDGTHLERAAICGLSAASLPREPLELACSLLDREALSGRQAIITDARVDPLSADEPGGFCSILCVPLQAEPSAVGTLHVYAAEARRFGEQESAMLRPLADLGAAAVAAARELAATEDAVAGRDRVMRVATHELRSPITVAQSLVRGVLKGYTGELTGKQAEIFERISRRLDFLERMVNDLLDLAADRAPESTEEEGPILLNASVGQVVLTLQPQAEEKGLEMTLDPCRERLVVWGTDKGLNRILGNLVSNAIKYTPSGGAVTISLCRSGGEARVEVTDTGIGIPEESLPHLFEDFYRAPNAKALGELGTGLGLTIVKTLVERCGGRVEVSSVLGEGSTFTVSLPIHRLAT